MLRKQARITKDKIGKRRNLLFVLSVVRQDTGPNLVYKPPMTVIIK